MSIQNSYTTVQGWMRTALHLKGQRLLAFAIIYGFSQDGVNDYRASLPYLMDWLGCSKPTAIQILKDLLKLNYISKSSFIEEGQKRNKYKANLEYINDLKNRLEVVKKFNQGGKKTLPGVVKKFNPIYNTNNIHTLKDENLKEVTPSVAKTLNQTTNEIWQLILENFAAKNQAIETAKSYKLSQVELKAVLREVVRNYQSDNINYILNDPGRYLSKILARLDSFAQNTKKRKSSVSGQGRNKNGLEAIYTPIEKL